MRSKPRGAVKLARPRGGGDADLAEAEAHKIANQGHLGVDLRVLGRQLRRRGGGHRLGGRSGGRRSSSREVEVELARGEGKGRGSASSRVEEGVGRLQGRSAAGEGAEHLEGGEGVLVNVAATAYAHNREE